MLLNVWNIVFTTPLFTERLYELVAALLSSAKCVGVYFEFAVDGHIDERLLTLS